MYNTTKPYKHQIKTLMKKTWGFCPYHEIYDDLYPIITTPTPPYKQIQHTDGCGTKGLLHWNNKSVDIIDDAFYMNFNDLLMMKAIPTTLQNHLVLPEDDHEFILALITRLQYLCIRHQIAMTGGETSIQNNIHGMDVSITMSGFIPREFTEYKNQFKTGDTIYGLVSTGPHSNGFTLIREIFNEEPPPEALTATRDYSIHRSTLEEANGIMHITGGAFSKLKDIMTPEQDISIKIPESPEIFQEIQVKGDIDDETMLKTFNCGIGMVFSYPKGKKAPMGIPLGEVKEGTGILTVNEVSL